MKISYILITLAVLGIIYGIFSWERFKYGECKKVGHGTAYCILKINS